MDYPAWEELVGQAVLQVGKKGEILNDVRNGPVLAKDYVPGSKYIDIAGIASWDSTNACLSLSVDRATMSS